MKDIVKYALVRKVNIFYFKIENYLKYHFINNNKMIFEVDNYIYNIDKLQGETDLYHNTKGTFIANLKPQDTEDFIYYEKMAKIYANIKHLDCMYGSEIINEINQLIEDLQDFTPITMN